MCLASTACTATTFAPSGTAASQRSPAASTPK
jgi:hypothetical protein